MGVMGFVYDTGDERHVEFLVSRDLCFLYLICLAFGRHCAVHAL
jgi:hypothetical protein